LVSDFLANLIPAPGASMKVVDANGIENRGILAVGDCVVVTSANSFTQVVYIISILIDDVNTFTNSSISIYPNPTSGIFNVIGIPAGSKIVIRSVLGQNLFETFVGNDNLQLSLEDQPAGIYFILISNDTNLACFKLFVK
jgi:hypothetical protein